MLWPMGFAQYHQQLWMLCSTGLDAIMKSAVLSRMVWAVRTQAMKKRVGGLKIQGQAALKAIERATGATPV